MKLTKMIASVLTGSLCLSVFCCGCTNTRETEDNKPVVDELPEDEVLIRSSHKNGAWGYDSSVTYVFSDGNVYSSSESFEGYYAYGQNNLTEEDRIALLKKYTKPRAYIDENQLLKIYQQAMQIDPDAEFVYEDLYACDAGTSVIEVNVDGEWIKLSESGDQKVFSIPPIGIRVPLSITGTRHSLRHSSALTQASIMPEGSSRAKRNSGSSKRTPASN